jgi:hypothetical protein
VSSITTTITGTRGTSIPGERAGARRRSISLRCFCDGGHRKALHPSASGVDLTYWGFIYPGEKLGLFYDVNYHGVNSQKRRSRKSE